MEFIVAAIGETDTSARSPVPEDRAECPRIPKYNAIHDPWPTHERTRPGIGSNITHPERVELIESPDVQFPICPKCERRGITSRKERNRWTLRVPLGRSWWL